MCSSPKIPAPKPPPAPPAPPIEMAKKVEAPNPKKKSYKSAGVSSLTIPMNRPGSGVSIPGA